VKFNLARFFKNAAILTLTSLILRLVGMFFRIWLANSIGSEGMGLYQLILSFYMLAATFAGGGITTAVTRLISEAISRSQRGAVRRIVLRAVTLVIGVGLVSAVAVIIFAKPIALFWIKDARAELSLKLLSLSLPFMAVTDIMSRSKGPSPSAKRIFLIKAYPSYFSAISLIPLFTLLRS